MIDTKEFSAVKIGKRIREVMDKRHISVRELAGETYITTNGIYRILSGKCYPSLYTAVLISKYLSISLNYLLLGE